MRKWLTTAATAGMAVTLAALAAGSASAAGAAPARVRAAAGKTSSGTFRRAVYLTVPAYSGDVAIGKVTGNGRNDLVVAGRLVPGNPHWPGYLWMYPQGRGGRLGAPQKFRMNNMTGDLQLAITDLYGNGGREIVLAAGGRLLVFSPRHGRLTGPVTLSPRYGVAHFAVTRVNADRYPDIVASTSANRVWIYYGSKTGRFRLGRTVRFRGGGTWFNTVYAASVRAGDRADLLYFDTRTFDLRLRNRDGSYGPMTRYQLAPVGGQMWPDAGVAALGDITGDGRTDMVLTTQANRPDAAVEVFPGNGGGRLSRPAIYHTLDIPAELALADLTGNGRNDLIIAHDGWNAIGVMLQQRDGRLGREALYPVAACCSQSLLPPATGDLNGDGKPDIAVADSTKIVILYQR